MFKWKKPSGKKNHEENFPTRRAKNDFLKGTSSWKMLTKEQTPNIFFLFKDRDPEGPEQIHSAYFAISCACRVCWISSGGTFSILRQLRVHSVTTPWLRAFPCRPVWTGGIPSREQYNSKKSVSNAISTMVSSQRRQWQIYVTCRLFVRRLCHFVLAPFHYKYCCWQTGIYTSGLSMRALTFIFLSSSFLDFCFFLCPFQISYVASRL